MELACSANLNQKWIFVGKLDVGVHADQVIARHALDCFQLWFSEWIRIRLVAEEVSVA
jgi:hypothetical protein